MSLPNFTREIAYQVVKDSLNQVADFDPNSRIEDYTFQHFHDYHKSVFSNEIKNRTNQVKDIDMYYDIAISPNEIDKWERIEDCIDYLCNEFYITPSKTENVNLSLE